MPALHFYGYFLRAFSNIVYKVGYLVFVKKNVCMKIYLPAPLLLKDSQVYWSFMF